MKTSEMRQVDESVPQEYYHEIHTSGAKKPAGTDPKEGPLKLYSMKKRSVVLDTNVFVAAAFEPSTASGRIVEAVHAGRLRLVWSESTRKESEHVLRKIPPIEWKPFERLFADDGRYDGELDVDRVSYIPDPTDRKFAALAEATGATLVSNDKHLLAERERGKTPILTPSEFWNRSEGERSG